MHSKFQLALFFGGHCTQLGATLREINVIESNCLSISPHITPKINYKTRGNRQPVNRFWNLFFFKRNWPSWIDWAQFIHLDCFEKFQNWTIFTLTWSWTRWTTSFWIPKSTLKFTIRSSDFKVHHCSSYFVTLTFQLFILYNLFCYCETDKNWVWLIFIVRLQIVRHNFRLEVWNSSNQNLQQF